MTQVKECWNQTTKIDMYTSKWHGWLLIYLSKKSLSGYSLSRAPNSPYKYTYIYSVDKICEKMPFDRGYTYNPKDIRNYFNNHQQISTSELREDDFDGLFGNGIADIVILFKNYYMPLVDVRNQIHDYFSRTIRNETYELRLIICTKSIGNRCDNWDSKVFSRHGGTHHSSWWVQERKTKLSLQFHQNSLAFGSFVVEFLVYKKLKKPRYDQLREDYLRYIGGQSHVHCSRHNMPLITSCDKNARCKMVKEGSNPETTCNKKASYCCPDVNCNTLLCKQCFNSFNKNNRHYIRFQETMAQTNDIYSDTSDNVSTVYDETSDDIDNNSKNSGMPDIDMNEFLNDINSDQSILSDRSIDDNIDEQDDFDSIIMENMDHDENNEYDDIDNLITYSDPPDIPYLD